MLHYKADWFYPTEGPSPSKADPSVKVPASETARLLRERAARYRELATTLYNETLIDEVEILARELEEEAAQLETGTYPYFEKALSRGFG